MLLPTMLVGLYAQPEGLIDRASSRADFPARASEGACRIPEAYLAIEGARIMRAELAAQ
jgi:hypothetical protein